MYRSLVRWMPVVILLLLWDGSAAFAQNGRISGQVSDGQGGAIPGATVQIVSQDSAIKREVTSDNGGSYTLPYLPPGKYQIFVHFDGFRMLASPVITLTAGQGYTYNAQLSVASETTEVNVLAPGETTAVDTQSASMSTTLSNREVTGYGLNGRNFSQLLSLAPGVSNQTGQDEAKVGVAGSAKFSVNGGRVEYNTFEVDGSDVLNTSINASRGQGEPLMVYPSIDAIQEMKVLTADYSALYGKSASGSVLVTTKSGTDKFHGNLYEFIRNEMFNARNYFDQPSQVTPNSPLVYKTPLYRRQDFGGTIGGPLFIPHFYNTGRKRTFFFWSEEMRLEKTPVDYNQAVPTTQERSGNFTDVCPTPVPGTQSTLLNLTTNPDCPFAPAPSPAPTGSDLALPAVNPGVVSTAILNTGIIPEPNSSFGCNTTNPTGLPKCYVASVSPSTYWREELFRIDHLVTPSQQLSFRYVHDSWNTTTLTPQWGVVQNSFPTVENRLNGPGLNMEVSFAGTLPHNFINRASISYAVEHISLSPQDGPGVTSLSRPAALDDMGYIFNNGFNNDRLPGLMFQGNNTEYGGHGFSVDTGYAPWEQDNPTFIARDDASRVLGNYSLQFGVYATLVQQNEQSAVSGANSGDTQGLLTFSNEQSRYTSGNAFADFLAGPAPVEVSGTDYTPAIKSFTQDSDRAKYYNRYKAVDLYLQDDWKVNKRLTLNVGIRASLFGAWYNAKGTAYNWTPATYNANLGDSVYVDPNYGYLAEKSDAVAVPLNRTGPYSLSGPNALDPTITNGLTQCGANGGPTSCMSSRLFYPGPRVGLSYDPSGDGRMAIHAGYGLFWEHGTGYEANAGSLIGSAPLVLSETQSNIMSHPVGTSNSNPSVTAYNAIGFSCQNGTSQCGNLPVPSGGATFPLNVTSIPSKAVYSYTQQWSLSVQRELHKNMVAQIGYVGTKGTHLTAVQDLNQLSPLSPSLNPFLAGQPITSQVCNSGATSPYYFTPAGQNTSPVTGSGIPSSPGIGSTSPGYLNMVVACTGNPGFVGPTGTVLGTSADSVRPYPGFSNIIAVRNIADSEYNSLQGTLRETTGPITLGIAYTWSHSLDDASDRSSANFANSLDIHSNHASSDFDQRQIINISYIYDLPLLHLLHGFTHFLVLDDAKASTGSTAREQASPVSTATPSSSQSGQQPVAPLLQILLGGWELSGITMYQTGTPFSVINGGSFNGTGPSDNAGVGDGLGVGSYVDVIGSAHGPRPFVAPGANEGPLLLNPGAFAAPRGLTFGNSGRNFLNNPSRTNFNMALLKHFKPFGEGRDLEFRAEAFNVFNHTQFRITDPANPGNTGNNVASCYGGQAEFYSSGASNCLVGQSFLHPVDAHDPRILQFGLKASF